MLIFFGTISFKKKFEAATVELHRPGTQYCSASD
jgi:hypothetical protein